MLSVNWPFRPAKLPFFYGWVVWLLSTLGFLFSIPGQTMGMAVFTDPFIETLGLTRTQLSMAYLLGTVSSSFFLTQAGRWYDRYGGRLMVTLASIALGVMVLYLSLVDWIAASLGGASWVAFALMFVGYFGVRFFGQGMLTSCSRNVLLTWFVRRRGLVSGIRSVFVSFGFSIAPLLLAYLIMAYGWRGALWLLALAGGIGFSLLALVFLRDNPQSCDLLPDGDSADDASETSTAEVNSATLAQARRSPVFWIYAGALGLHALVGTALTFHVVSIFGEAGRSSEEAFGYFLPAAVFSTATNLLASTIVDRFALKPFLVVMLLGFITGAWGLLHLEATWGFWTLAFGFGVGGGLWGVISNLAFIRLYGPLHLGEVSGFNTSISVFASAIGPAAFSVGLDVTGSYSAVINVCLVALALLLVAAIAIRQEEL